MRRPAPMALVALAAAVCIAVLVVVLLSRGSPREYLTHRYDRQSGEGSSVVLLSPHPASETAADLRRKWKPAQELTDPAGVFFRYSDLIVANTPRPEGGSLVHLDDERRGYAHWYGFVGGDWGTGGGVDGVRGGGPGAGK